MSQKVLTFNLILSTKKSLVEAALATKSLSELGDDPRFKNLSNFKFFTLNNNKSLISFEYSTFRSDPKKLSFTLQFLDYDGFFEYHMLSSNINDYIIRYLNRENIRKNEKEGVNPFHIFYICFGTSSDFTQWSGPFATFLNSSEYEFTPEGVKKITLTFTNLDGGVALSNMQKITNSNNTYKSKFNTTPINVVLESNILDIKNLKEFEARLFDNKIFPRLISDYIRAYTNQESVVLIPDMMQFFNYYQSLKNSRSDARKDSGNLNIDDQLYELEAVDFFSEFGLNLLCTVRNPKKQQIKNSTITEQNNELEERRVKEGSLQFSLSMRVSTPESQVSRGGSVNEFPDGYIPLQKMADGLSKLISTKSIASYNLYEESDTKILALWKKLEIIKDDSKPVIVWGRSDYIYNNLYPKLDSTYNNSDLYKELKNKLDQSYVKNVKALYMHTYNSDFNESLGNNIEDFSKNITQFRTVPIEDKSLRSYKIPVFKSNVKNPNVLEYRFSNNKQNLGLLQLTVQSILDYAIQDSADLLTSTDSGVRNKVFQYKSNVLDKYLDANLGGLYSKDSIDLINNSLPKSVKTKDPLSNSLGSGFGIQKTIPNKNKSSADQYKKFIEFQKEIKELKSLQQFSSKIIGSNFENATQLQQKLNNLMSNQLVLLQIKTLPFFSLTGLKYFGFPCLFLQRLFNNFISPLTNAYTIIGIRHVANTEEMYSEFELSREGFGTNDNSDTQIQPTTQVNTPLLNEESGPNPNNF